MGTVFERRHIVNFGVLLSESYRLTSFSSKTIPSFVELTALGLSYTLCNRLSTPVDATVGICNTPTMSEPVEVAVKQIRVFPTDYEALEKDRAVLGRRATTADVISEWRKLLGK